MIQARIRHESVGFAFGFAFKWRRRDSNLTYDKPACKPQVRLNYQILRVALDAADRRESVRGDFYIELCKCVGGAGAYWDAELICGCGYQRDMRGIAL